MSAREVGVLDVFDNQLIDKSQRWIKNGCRSLVCDPQTRCGDQTSAARTQIRRRDCQRTIAVEQSRAQSSIEAAQRFAEALVPEQKAQSCRQSRALAAVIMSRMVERAGRPHFD